MAVVQSTPFLAEGHSAQQVRILVWGHMHQGDSGAWSQLPAGVNRSMHVWGVFGGATVTFEGSNEVTLTPANPVSLRDPGMTVISMTTKDLRQVLEAPYQVRPLVTGGDGT